MPGLPDHQWITDAAGCRALTAALQGVEAIALDIEADSMHRYREQLCLIQLNVADVLWIVDPLAVDTEDLIGLASHLADASTVCQLHGGEYDVACLKRHLGIDPRGVVDSQQAAQLLGYERTGYGALVAAVTGIDLPKGHSTYDWATRPVAEDALAYALDDVRYLPTVIAALQAEIVKRDLEEEYQIACAAVEAATGGQAAFTDAVLWRVAGVSKLSEDKLPILLALLRWREDLARTQNLPAGRLFNNKALLRMAQVGPTNFGSLKRLDIHGRFLRDHGRDALEIIKEARRAPPALPERPPKREPDPLQLQREKHLRHWRRGEAEKREVTEQAVLPAKAIEHLAREGAADLAVVPQLGDKRIRLYGDILRKLCS